MLLSEGIIPAAVIQSQPMKSWGNPALRELNCDCTLAVPFQLLVTEENKMFALVKTVSSLWLGFQAVRLGV